MHCEITTGTTWPSESVPAFLSSSTSLPWLSSSWSSWNRCSSCPCCPCCFFVLVLVVLYTFSMIVLIMITLKQVSSVFGYPSSLPWISLMFSFTCFHDQYALCCRRLSGRQSTGSINDAGLVSNIFSTFWSDIEWQITDKRLALISMHAEWWTNCECWMMNIKWIMMNDEYQMLNDEY